MTECFWKGLTFPTFTSSSDSSGDIGDVGDSGNRSCDSGDSGGGDSGDKWWPRVTVWQWWQVVILGVHACGDRQVVTVVPCHQSHSGTLLPPSMVIKKIIFWRSVNSVEFILCLIIFIPWTKKFRYSVCSGAEFSMMERIGVSRYL
jgi:hypothetical protein